LKQDRPNSSDFPNFYYPIHSSIKELWYSSFLEKLVFQH
jgi:hypothetical protein